MRTARRKSKFAVQEDADPLSVVVNLFDVAMVFAVALMVAMVMHMNMTEVFTQEDFTIVKNPGKDNMEIIMKEGNKIKTVSRAFKKRVQSYIIYRDFSPYSKIHYSYEVKIISNTFVGSIDIKT